VAILSQYTYTPAYSREHAMCVYTQEQLNFLEQDYSVAVKARDHFQSAAHTLLLENEKLKGVAPLVYRILSVISCAPCISECIIYAQ